MSANPTKLSPFAVFRNPGFRRMWTAQLVSTIGDSFTMIAAGIYVFRLTGSSLQVGLIMMATSIPTMLVGMISGVMVDRYDRKKIMIAADISRGVLVALIPLLVHHHIAWLYAIVMLTSGIKTFFDPAYESVIPEMATDEELSAANAMISISSFGSTAVGFAASGLLASYSIELAFYIDGISYFISALLLRGVVIAPLKVVDKTTVRVVLSNLKTGVHYIFSSAILRSLMVIGLVYAFFVGMGNTLLLPFSREALHASEFEYGIQEGMTSIGFVVGSLVLARYADRWREGVWLIASLAGMAVTYLIYSLSTSIPLAVFIITLSGFANAPYGIARRTMMQRNTEREIRGRVGGAFMTINHVMMLLGMGAAGLADLYGARTLMLVATGLNFVALILAMVLPGIGRPAADWLRGLKLLGQAAKAPALGRGRPATLVDLVRLAVHMPVFAHLTLDERKELLTDMQYVEAPEGTPVVKQGEVNESAFFIIEGGAIAGRKENDQDRVLEVLNAGDFFGEIAALTGVPRTANVVTNKAAVLLRVPASTLRLMMKHTEVNQVLMSKLRERMTRVDMVELPKMLAYDQHVLRDLRTPEQPVPAAAT